MLLRDCDESEQRKTLRQAIYRVRRSLGEGVVLEDEHGDLFICDALIETDALEFQRLAAGDPDAKMRALALYRGPFLDGEPSLSPEAESWLVAQRRDLQERALRAALDICANDLARGDFAVGLAHSRRALELDPLCEEAHRTVVLCLNGQGERASALRHLERAKRQLRHELGVDVDPETAALAEALASRPTVASPRAERSSIRARSAAPTESRWVGGAAALAVLALSAVALFSAGPFRQRPSISSAAPSVAVLPFTVAQGEAMDKEEGESLAAELASILASYPGLSLVVGRHAVGPTAIAVGESRDAPSQYVATGELRRTGDDLRVRAQLADTRTGVSVWSGEFTSSSGGSSLLRARIAESINETLVGFTGVIEKEEQRQAWRKPDGDLLEHDYARRGEQLLMRFDPHSHAAAREIWRKGLDRYPDSLRLRLDLAFSYRAAVEAGYGSNPAADLAEACRLGGEVARAPRKTRVEDWLSHWLEAKLAQWCRGDFGRSILEAEAAHAMAPHNSRAQADLAELLANAGRVDKAAAWLKSAIDRDPAPRDWYFRNLAWVYYLQGQDALALETLRRQRDMRPSALLAVLYGRLGQRDEAQQTLSNAPAIQTTPSFIQEIRRPLSPILKPTWARDLNAIGVMHD